MNKAKIYPWIFATVFGVVGAIVCALIGLFYENLANDVIWGKGPVNPNIVGTTFILIGSISFGVIFTIIFYNFSKDPRSFILGPIIGFVIYMMTLGLSRPDNGCCSPATGVTFSSLVGIISGWIVEVINDREDHIPIIVCGVFGAIIGGIFYNHGFIVSLPIVPVFASIGYAIAVPIKEKAEQRAEIKRRAELERERRIGEEERRGLEYEQKIKGYKAKLEQWEREGYDVSKLRERWFK